MNRFYICIFLILSLMMAGRAEEWRLHPAFDNNPVRIIDTEDKTYFLVHQQIYNKSLVDYDRPSLILFLYDKKNPEQGIQPLINSVRLSGTGIALADYSQEGRYLFVGYEDGGVDMVGDDGYVRHIDVLCGSPVPGVNHISSVCFEPGTADAWVATGAGYLHISGKSFAVEKSALLTIPVDYICRVGDGLILLSQGKFYEAPVGAGAKENIVAVPSLQNMTSCALMPLDAGNFAFLSGTAGQSNNLTVATRSGRDWNTEILASDTFYYLYSDCVVANPFESNIIPNKDGYLLYSSSKAWQLVKGERPSVLSLTREDGGITGSYDFKDFWEYRMRGNFVPRHATYTLGEGDVSASPVWSDKEEPIRPNAPASYICTYMACSPEYGSIVSQHASDWNFLTYGQVNPQLTSVLDGNQWRVVSQAYHIPYMVENDPAMLSKYHANRNAFPLSDPRGVLIDPLFKDYIWQGSLWSGMGMTSLKDDRENMRRFAAPNNPFPDYPSFQAIIENQGWGTMSCFSPLSADTDGTLWSVHFNYRKSVELVEPIELMYLTADRRKEMMQTPSTVDYAGQTWKKLDIPLKLSANMHCQVLALRHPRNRNRIVIFPSAYSAPLLIYDHKGTPDDSSDDEITMIPSFRNPAIGNAPVVQLNDMVEDPLTGNVIVGCQSYGWEFDPASARDGAAVDVSLLRLGDDNGREGDFMMPLSTGLNKILFDDYGRMWLATAGDGVIGVSADRSRIIARYRPDNSPLPSGMTYGLGWNTQRGSLMISTAKGLAEVFPDSPAMGNASGAPTLYPEQITPGYNGELHLRNLPANSRIEIRDKAGERVAILSNGSSTTLAYNLTDTTGNPLPSGIYTVAIGGVTLTFSLLR